MVTVAMVTSSVALAHEGQEEDEDVDNVNVQLQSAIDVLLRRQLLFLASHDHLGVIDQELQTGTNCIVLTPTHTCCNCQNG